MRVIIARVRWGSTGSMRDAKPDWHTMWLINLDQGGPCVDWGHLATSRCTDLYPGVGGEGWIHKHARHDSNYPDEAHKFGVRRWPRIQPAPDWRLLCFGWPLHRIAVFLENCGFRVSARLIFFDGSRSIHWSVFPSASEWSDSDFQWVVNVWYVGNTINDWLHGLSL